MWRKLGKWLLGQLIEDVMNEIMKRAAKEQK